MINLSLFNLSGASILVSFAVVVFTLSFLATEGARKWMRELGVIDIPNHRSSHSKPVVRGGGIGPAISITVSLIFCVLVFPAYWAQLGVLLFVVVASASLGWAEDRWGVPVRYRLGAQALIGAITTVAFITLFSAHWAWLPVLIFFFASYVNVANFMDGINGISALHGGAIGLVYLFIGLIYNLPWLALVSVVMAAAFLGFLPANASGKVFLGDVGSYLLGGLIAGLAIGAFSAGVPGLVVLSPLVIYLADTGFTLVKRIMQGETWSEAHRDHVFQQLAPRFLTHLSASVAICLASILSGGLVLALYSKFPLLWIVGVLGFIAAAYLLSPKIAAGVRRE